MNFHLYNAVFSEYNNVFVLDYERRHVGVTQFVRLKHLYKS